MSELDMPAGADWVTKIGTSTQTFTYKPRGSWKVPKPPHGVQMMRLKNSPGTSSITLSAMGDLVPRPALPLASPEMVTVQLMSAAGGCWEALYDAATQVIQSNTDRYFKATSYGPLLVELGENECANESSSRNCQVAADAPCAPSPFNCKQKTKLCDPRPRTARRDNPGSKCFPTAAGVPLTDSLGNELGRLNDTRVRLNFGIHRDIGGDVKVMAFSAATTTGLRSGWVSRSVVGHVPDDSMAIPSLPDGGPTFAQMIVPDGWSDYRRNLKTDVSYCDGDTGFAFHYLGRSGTVNMVWNTPGLGSPTAEIYPNNANLTFRQATNVGVISVPLYDCNSRQQVDAMEFAYGYVQEGRWGWIARANLTRPCGNHQVDPGEECDGTPDCDGSCYFYRLPCDVTCCDGTRLSVRARTAEECTGYAGSGMCNSGGNWTFAAFNGVGVASAACSDQCGIECCSRGVTQQVGGLVSMRGPAGYCVNLASKRCGGSGLRNALFYPGGAGHCSWTGAPWCEWNVKNACASVP